MKTSIALVTLILAAAALAGPAAAQNFGGYLAPPPAAVQTQAAGASEASRMTKTVVAPDDGRMPAANAHPPGRSGVNQR